MTTSNQSSQTPNLNGGSTVTPGGAQANAAVQATAEMKNQQKGEVMSNSSNHSVIAGKENKAMTVRVMPFSSEELAKINAFAEQRERWVAEADAVRAEHPVSRFDFTPSGVFTGELVVGLVGYSTSNDSNLVRQALTSLATIKALASGAADLEAAVKATKVRLVQVDLSNGKNGVSDVTMADALATVRDEYPNLSLLLVNPTLRIGNRTQEELNKLNVDHGVAGIYPASLALVGRMLRDIHAFRFTDANGLARVLNGNTVLGMKAEVAGNVVTVSKKLYHDSKLAFSVTVNGDGTLLFNDRKVKDRNVLIAANPMFAACGNTLIGVMDARDIFAASLLTLVDGCTVGSWDTYGYRWTRSMEAFLAPNRLNERKQSAAARRFNADNVLGGFTVYPLNDGRVAGGAEIRSKAMAGQLYRTLGKSYAFLPAAKGDYVIAYSPAELASGDHNWTLDAKGNLLAHQKNTKHTAGFNPNVCGEVTLPVAVMPGTNITVGGAMPVDAEALAMAVGIEDKTLTNDPPRQYKTETQRAAAVADFVLKVAVGEVIRPGQVLATIDGKVVTWNTAKGASWAKITEARIDDKGFAKGGRPTVGLVIKAVVGYHGIFKGRGIFKVMATPTALCATTMEVMGDNGWQRFAGGFLSSGACKVDNTFGMDFVETARKPFRITRQVTVEILDILVATYAVGCRFGDTRFSYDRDALTVTWQGEAVIGYATFGIESSHVAETIGNTGPLLTQLAFTTAADAFGKDADGVGIGTSVLRDIYGTSTREKAALVGYLKEASSSLRLNGISIGDRGMNLIGVVPFVKADDGTLRLKDIAIRPADEMGRDAKLAAGLSADMTDVELLKLMIKAKIGRFVFITDDRETQDLASVALIDCAKILAISNAGSKTGTLAGLGHTVAELIRLVLFKDFGKEYARGAARFTLLAQLRKQLRHMAFGSKKINQIHRQMVGVLAKVVPTWHIQRDEWLVYAGSQIAKNFADKFGCPVEELDGKQVLTGRHPVTAMAVKTLRVLSLDAFEAIVGHEYLGSLEVIVVNELAFRTETKGDTDGDQAFGVPIKDTAKAMALKAAFEAMLPGGDINLALLGVPSSAAESELFVEAPKAGETLDTVFHKDVADTREAWGRKLDEGAHSALTICGSSYKMNEFLSYLAGVGRINVRAALVGIVLYEDRGLAGAGVSMKLKDAISLYQSGLTTRVSSGHNICKLMEFRNLLSWDLGKGVGTEVAFDDEATKGLGMGSEFAWCARANGIPTNKEDGSELIDRVGGETAHYDELWRVVAIIQALGRGHINRADQLLLELQAADVDAAEALVGPNFLLDLVRDLAVELAPKVRWLKALGDLETGNGAGGGSDAGDNDLPDDDEFDGGHTAGFDSWDLE